MSRRLAMAVLLIAPAVAVIVADAIDLQRHQPHPRIALLTAYAIAPALIGALCGAFARRRAAFILLVSAGALPPLLRFLFGIRSVEGAFGRLTLNAVWFTLIWMPAALAVVVLTGPPSPTHDRPTFFGRRLWRPAAAFLLSFVALTFVSRGALPPAALLGDVAFAFSLALLGMGLLVSDALPPRKEWVALHWTWMIMALLSALLTLGGGLEVDQARRERQLLRSDAEGALSGKRRMLATAAQFEKRGTRTRADRLLRGYAAEYDDEHRAALAALDATSSRLPLAVTMTVVALAATVLFIALAIAAHRQRGLAAAERT